jgi:hypothetical protein
VQLGLNSCDTFIASGYKDLIVTDGILLGLGYSHGTYTIHALLNKFVSIDSPSIVIHTMFAFSSCENWEPTSTDTNSHLMF